MALVSIATEPEDFANREGFGAVLRVRFDDLTPELAEQGAIPPGVHIRLFSEDDARSIWEFVLDARNRGLNIWIHCRMGISRSPAVAAALGTLLDKDDQGAFQRARPNPFVHQIMMWVGQGLLDDQMLPEDTLPGLSPIDATAPPPTRPFVG